MIIRFAVITLIVISGSCTLFDELLEPSDISRFIVPSLDILSHTNNELVGQGYILSGTVVSISAPITTIRVIVDNVLTQDTVPNGNDWSVAVNTVNGVHVNDVYAIDQKGKVSPKKSITLDQHTIPLYNIKLKDNEVMVIYDFSHTYNPIEWGVVPFLYSVKNESLGEDWLNYWQITNFYKNAGIGADCMGKGIKIDGTGDQVLKYDADSGYYYSILTIPSSFSGDFEFEPANYSLSGWNELDVNFYTYFGFLNVPLYGHVIRIQNQHIIQAEIRSITMLTQKDIFSPLGMFLSICGKRVLFDIGLHGGWSLHLPGGTMANQVIKLIWTNIPSVVVTGTNYWWPLEFRVSNSVADFNNIFPVVCGYSSTIFPINWDPVSGGLYLTNFDPVKKTASVVLNVPPGSARGLKCKFACSLGWIWGSQLLDAYIPFPTISDPGITNVIMVLFQ